MVDDPPLTLQVDDILLSLKMLGREPVSLDGLMLSFAKISAGPERLRSRQISRFMSQLRPHQHLVLSFTSMVAPPAVVVIQATWPPQMTPMPLADPTTPDQIKTRDLLVTLTKYVLGRRRLDDCGPGSSARAIFTGTAWARGCRSDSSSPYVSCHSNEIFFSCLSAFSYEEADFLRLPEADIVHNSPLPPL